MLWTTFRSQILFLVSFRAKSAERRSPALSFLVPERPPRPPIPRPLLYGRGGRRAEPAGGEGAGPHAAFTQRHCLLCLHQGCFLIGIASRLCTSLGVSEIDDHLRLSQ